MKIPLPRLIAFYLPQFHPIPENNEWWGEGFTEWTNTAKAKPLFPGHYQPHVPSDLGFYDLRLPEARLAQANLARRYGIHGFCYYHYWFGNGKRLLELPFKEVLESGEPNYPFCLCWANESWSGVWHNSPNKILIEQQYPGPKDDENHFESVLPAFNDPRYLRINNCPIFIVYKPFSFPNPEKRLLHWRKMARSAGLDDIHFVGMYAPGGPNPEDYGFDASIYHHGPPTRSWVSWRNPLKKIYGKFLTDLGVPTIYSYKKAINYFLPNSPHKTRYPSVMNGWDNTPRSGVNGRVINRITPDLYREALDRSFALTRFPIKTDDQRLIFLKSWNEWAEGNHLEPDLRDGHAYLQVILDILREEKELIQGI